MPPQLIVLDVSGRVYRTNKATLQASPYFENLMTRWDDCSDRQDDGSFFVDADPHTFQHVLNFMRRPSKFPLFWTKETGFDYALYNKLEAEADYFLLHELRDWIREKRYLEAFRTVVEVKAMTEDQLVTQKILGTDVEVQSFFGNYVGKERVCGACRCNIDLGFKYGCDACRERMKSPKSQLDNTQTKLTVVTKWTEFDATACDNKTGS
ncbi:hypothetical protein C7974DRAFT_118349 [Boeremia exigua]|uniref:uncharacterized protein n=1 Tax=Boeremia exigua TaxID=749465 RepID=UPI001E8DABFB|nr:uncharacterized protein C7974DRAFT_118349 [Boeremia exigua]KAH6643154.1 hypothetical protein C7974DRAFT_118349 [Boeremia exigua]